MPNKPNAQPRKTLRDEPPCAQEKANRPPTYQQVNKQMRSLTGEREPCFVLGYN